MKHYIIREINNTEESLYWNNEMGFVDKELADIFTEDDIFFRQLTLPIGGEWEELNTTKN